jgi:hypothetical protein
MPEGLYDVILSHPDDLQLDKIAEILSKTFKVPLIDARLQARKSWGFLGERMEEGQARLLSAEAARLGLNTLRVAETSTERMPAPQNVRSARCADDGFYFNVGTDSHEKGFPWDKVRLFCAAGLREEFTVTKTVKEDPTGTQQLMGIGLTMTSGLPIGGGKGKEMQKAVKQAEISLFADVFVGGGSEGSALLRLHINAEGFNFGYLGNRKEPHVLGNFRLLLKDIAKGAGQALRNKGAQIILAEQPLNTQGYDSRADYEKECRWLLSLIS